MLHRMIRSNIFIELNFVYRVMLRISNKILNEKFHSEELLNNNNNFLNHFSIGIRTRFTTWSLSL